MNIIHQYIDCKELICLPKAIFVYRNSQNVLISPRLSPILLSSLFQVAYVVLSLCVGVLCELKFGHEEVCVSILGAVKGDDAILFGKVLLWMLVVVFTACAQRHHGRARSRGYLRFYRRTQGLKYLPINVHSTGTEKDSCFSPTRWR